MVRVAYKKMKKRQMQRGKKGASVRGCRVWETVACVLCIVHLRAVDYYEKRVYVRRGVKHSKAWKSCREGRLLLRLSNLANLTRIHKG